MGFLKKEAQESIKDAKPWFMPTGTYGPCHLRRIEIHPQSEPANPIFELFFLPTIEAARSARPPSPLDIPELGRRFDLNIREEAEQLFKIIGKPAGKDPVTKKPVWDGTGLFQWNGAVGDLFRAKGECDLDIFAKEPRKRDQGGYWPISYRVDDICPVGEKQEATDAALSQAATALEYMLASEGHGVSVPEISEETEVAMAVASASSAVPSKSARKR